MSTGGHDFSTEQQVFRHVYRTVRPFTRAATSETVNHSLRAAAADIIGDDCFFRSETPLENRSTYNGIEFPRRKSNETRAMITLGNAITRVSRVYLQSRVIFPLQITQRSSPVPIQNDEKIECICSSLRRDTLRRYLPGKMPN